MSRQIVIISTKNEVLDIIETTKQRFPELYIWEEISECSSIGFWEAYLKSSSVDDSEIGETDYDRSFASIHVCSSQEIWDHGHYLYGRVYIRTWIWRDAGGESILEEQYPELMKIYNYMVRIVRQRCTRRYGNKSCITYALPEGDKIYYPIHDIFKLPVYVPNSSAKK